jgi:hypothetical protein
MYLGVEDRASGGIRPLSREELLMVGGGDDGSGCVADGCTVGSDPGIGDSAAQALMAQIDFAFTDPIFAFFAFFGLLIHSPPPPTTGAPVMGMDIMGNPSPGDSGP